ncbi:MAG: biotin/lipoyl-binding protein [Clostridiales bacterium]|nr:biotin/lipoyl-binding protein [Clostridiales bacterium]
MKKYNVTVNGETFAVEVEEIDATNTSQVVPVIQAAPAPVPTPVIQEASVPAPAPVSDPDPAPIVQAAPTIAPEPPAPQPVAAASGNVVASPLPGTVLRVNVTVGQAVKPGEVLLVLEAMKMENDITAPSDGIVSAIHVAGGSIVQTGDALISL